MPMLLACLGLSACFAVGPDYVPPEVDIPAVWNRLNPEAEPILHDVAIEDLNRWWENFRDPLLSRLAEEALLKNHDLWSARARLREVRARRTVAAAGRFPEVTASGTASRSRSSREIGGGGTNDFFSAGFDASWEADIFGGIRRGIEAAEADVESSLARLYDTRISLLAETARNYTEVRALQIRLDIARANLASQIETLQLTSWRAQAGLVNSQDVAQARSNMEQTRAQIPSLEISLAEAEHRLDILLGLVPGTLHARLSEPRALPEIPHRIAIGIPADALRRRPDVRAAERTLAAETARVGVAEAARYPAFTLLGSIGVEALTTSGLGSDDAGTSSLLAGIIAPIFNAGRLRAQAQAQDAVRAQAMAAYEQTVLTALQEVENALVALIHNDRRSKALAIAAEAANNAAELARQRYSAGLIDFQSVLDTERTVLTVEDNLAATRAEEVLSLIRLYKALGGGWSPQEEIREGTEKP